MMFTTEQIVTLLVPTLTALAAFIQSRQNLTKISEIHLMVNSRLSQLLLATEEAARSAGHAAGKAEEAAKHSITATDAVKEVVAETAQVVIKAVKDNGNAK